MVPGFSFVRSPPTKDAFSLAKIFDIWYAEPDERQKFASCRCRGCMGKEHFAMKRFSALPFAAAGGLGILLFALSRPGGMGSLSDFLFCLGSGALLVGLFRLLSNLRAFASFFWGVRFLKRLFRGEARGGREETEDYRLYRESRGGHADAGALLFLSGLLFALSAMAARF